jgi:GT2 family glycosyltransferase
MRTVLPTASSSTSRPLALQVESVVATSEDSFFIAGWYLDAYAPLERLTAVSPEGLRYELIGRHVALTRAPSDRASERIWRATDARPIDVRAEFTLVAPSFEPAGWVVELVDLSGRSVQTSAPPVVREPASARNAILFGLPLAALPNQALMAEHVAPALQRVQRQAATRPDVVTVVTHGTPPLEPAVSIIVPLYGRIDFVEHQLAQFADDPDLTAADLVYVLDSPELAESLRDQADQLHRVYPTPFRVVTLAHNVGYAAANAVGVAHARGRLLLFLNSDVLPDRRGWLSAMQRFFDATPGIGALGPKLLYADETIQHAGMYFDKPSGTALAGAWQNVHYYKGLPRQLPAAMVSRPVPALTGACLMLDRQVYERVGGFQETYLQGDYEDSDLCLRLEQARLTRWYLAEVELYHLEGQSYPSELRGRMALYNRWLQTQLWDDAIERLMAHDWSPGALATQQVDVHSSPAAPQRPHAR